MSEQAAVSLIAGDMEAPNRSSDNPKMAKPFLSSGDSKWTFALALFSGAVLLLLSRNHAFAPMWVEGMPEFEETLRIMLGFDQLRPDHPGCWLRLRGISLPLTLKQYIGPAWIYFYGPTAYLWFSGMTGDPYIYRYTSILVFLADGWIFYYLLRQYYKTSVSFYGAVAFMVTPQFLSISITEYPFPITLVFILLTALFFSRYIKQGSVVLLLASAMALGMTILARIESLVWLIIPFVIYLVLARPPTILERWKEIKSKSIVTALALAAFCLGAAPMIAYNLICPNNVFSFIINSVLPKSLDTTSLSLFDKLIIRIEQFWSYNLLNIWTMWELHVPNYIFAVLWLLSMCVIIARWIAGGHTSLLVIIILTTLPLSLLTTGELRDEHLTVLQPVVLLTVVSALAYVERLPSTHKLAHIAFLLLIFANIVVSATNWRNWNLQPATSQTMLNQSDPALLAEYLSQHHANNDRILYTNIGLPQYIQYMSSGRLRGEDIMDWYDVNGFTDAVKLALMDKERRRVFVAVSKERDGYNATLPRTRLLYNTLNQYNVPYTVTPLSNKRNQYLYDLVVVDKGHALGEEFLKRTLLVSNVADMHIETQPSGSNLVFGSVRGMGFKRGDVIIVNANLIVPTTFGNESWITFALPSGSIETERPFTLEVFRPRTLERSKPHIVHFKT